MYTSLHKVDIVAKDPSGQRSLFVQTDHRSAEEVASELETSVIFALARILLPRRMPDGKTAVVRYVCAGAVHPTLKEVIASTDAQLEASGESVALDGVRRRPAADFADEAFASLGKRVLALHRLEANEAGLATYEAIAAASPPPPRDEDEGGHWTAITELAAVTGEVLRAKYGGRWVDDPKDYADIPFMFKPARESGLVNPVGKAVKFFLHGAAESPRQLLQLIEDAGKPDGPILFSLKPSHWGMRGEAVCEPLFAGGERAGADIPILVYGRDQPNTFALFMKDGKREQEMSGLRTEALAALSRIEASAERIDLEGLTFWGVDAGYFGAEKILDVAFMKSMHERLKTPMLAAAIPAKSQLLLTNGVEGPETMLRFMALARGLYEKNEGGRQLSPTVFAVAEGVIVGVATTASEAPPKKKGFFGRLLH